MRRACQALVWLVLVAGAASRARADERILDYHVDLVVHQDGSLDVAEHIRVRCEGDQIRRGIYRDFPTRYQDRFGNRVVVDMHVLGVERDGMPEPWFTESRANGIRINTGNDTFLPQPNVYEFTLRYQTTRQLGFFADHDELYWNAIGTGWLFTIDQGSVDLQLPAPVPIASMSALGYTGAQGERGTDYHAELIAPGHAQFTLTRALAPLEGLTIVVTFPKGIIPEPSNARRAAWFLRDNRGVLVALLGLIALLAYCTYEWGRVGRDPDKGVIIPRYEPPVEHTPASLRYVMRMGYDMRCFSSDVLSLAVAGCLHIDREKHLLHDTWSLEQQAPQHAPVLTASQQVLLEGLFAAGSPLVLRDSNARIISAARSAHASALDQQTDQRYFKLNGLSVLRAFSIALPPAVLAFVIAGGAGIVAIAIVVALMVLTLIVFARLVPAPTREGRKLADEIEGLKLYLSVAERDELAHMRGPGAPAVLDAARYERLLPFAVALEVEDAWTAKFTAAAGAAAAAAAAAGIGWYRGGPISSLGELSHAVGSSLNSSIASAATPPGSSSGGGGGGSSGGGGGGGGGGGR